MKSPTEWDESDLLGFIKDRTEEHLQLEWKRAQALDNTDSKKSEISKDVSAFANAAGGTIVYGMEESQGRPNFAQTLSPIDPNKTSKEWLEQIINSKISPRIEGLRINPIKLSNSYPGMYAYVVSIPEGTTAYQAADKRYYRRYNFESVPMEDYEVRLEAIS